MPQSGACSRPPRRDFSRKRSVAFDLGSCGEFDPGPRRSSREGTSGHGVLRAPRTRSPWLCLRPLGEGSGHRAHRRHREPHRGDGVPFCAGSDRSGGHLRCHWMRQQHRRRWVVHHHRVEVELPFLCSCRRARFLHVPACASRAPDPRLGCRGEERLDPKADGRLSMYSDDPLAQVTRKEGRAVTFVLAEGSNGCNPRGQRRSSWKPASTRTGAPSY